MEIDSAFRALLLLSCCLIFCFTLCFSLQRTFFFFSSSLSSLPGPGILHYFPNGLLYPMLLNPDSFSRVIEKLGDVYGDVFTMWIGPTRVCVTAIPEDVKHILSAAEDFDRPPAVKSVFQVMAPDGILCMTGSKHRYLRKKIRDGFHHGMIDSFHGQMTDATRELCDSLYSVCQNGVTCSSETVDLSEVISIATFRVVTQVAFGVALSREKRLEFLEKVRELADEMTRDIVSYPIREILEPLGSRRRLFKVCDSIRETCAGFLEMRMKGPQLEKNLRSRDLLDALLATENTSLETLTSMVTEFTLGGTYSMSQLIIWGVYEVCCNENIRNKIEKELDREMGTSSLQEPISFESFKKLDYVRNVWKETCRIHPVGPFMTRQTTRNITLKGSGLQLRKGTEVFADYRRCHLCPQQWNDSASFRPERWHSVNSAERGRPTTGLFIPFGLGPHTCPGNFLADHEGALIMAELFRRFRFTLACRPGEVRASTTFVETPVAEIGERVGVQKSVPFYVQLRGT